MTRLGLVLAIGAVFVPAATADEPAKGAVRAPISRADQPPRKVLVGTAIHGPWGKPPKVEDELVRLRAIVDAMARQAEEKSPRHGLDLAILPEQAVSPQGRSASARAIRLDGALRKALGEIARAHHTYLIAPMDLAEDGPNGTTYSNAAVLFDRQGQVAGVYRKAHPVAMLGTDELEDGITPGREFPVFDCDFGRIGIQICWDIVFEDGWDALGRQGAELVAWPSASPATALPAARAGRHRYYIISSTARDNATVFEPTGMIAAQVQGREAVLVHEIDLSFAVLGWSARLDNGKALREKFGSAVGFHYESREDLGLFWSNDPKVSIRTMIDSLGLEEIDAQIERNRRLQDAARGAGGRTDSHSSSTPKRSQ